MRIVKRFICVYAISAMVVNSLDVPRDELDKVIEDELTEKLSVDLLQSIERKFQVDLEKSVDLVLAKIKMLLRNGTAHIQEKMLEIQGMVDAIRSQGDNELEKCLVERQNETSALAEKALHQMVVCGYALIGHDPAQAVTRVMGLKTMITDGIKPIYEEKKEINSLLRVCGHDHETLKKVIKCVISKSPIIKSAMMDITTKLIEGVVDLTKLMAHGAMHEACLIEVVKTTEDEAVELIKKVKRCAHGNKTADELELFIAENNATVLDISKSNKTANVQNKTVDVQKKNEDLTTLFRRMLANSKTQKLDKKFKKKLSTLQKALKDDVDDNVIAG